MSVIPPRDNLQVMEENAKLDKEVRFLRERVRELEGKLEEKMNTSYSEWKTAFRKCCQRRDPGTRLNCSASAELGFRRFYEEGCTPEDASKKVSTIWFMPP